MCEVVVLEQQVAGIFRDVLKISVPTCDTDLIATGMLDSLGFVDLVLHLEERFGIQVAMERLEPAHFRSIRSIAAFVAGSDGRRASQVDDRFDELSRLADSGGAKAGSAQGSAGTMR